LFFFLHLLTSAFVQPLFLANASSAASKLSSRSVLKFSISTVPLDVGEKSGCPSLKAILSTPYFSDICFQDNFSGLDFGFLGTNSGSGIQSELPS